MIAARIGEIDWDAVATALDADGVATVPALLDPEACAAIAASYDDERLFRSTVVMARHGFGRGQYRYFAQPLPPAIVELRSSLYPRLVDVANRWQAALGDELRFPATHAELLARCHADGQTRPTPLVLDYGPGDHNCLHQDLYGPHVFPLQVAILLARPGVDFTGGELVLTEQRPRMQSRVQVVPLARGDAAIFAVHRRPVAGARGSYRVAMRHGVSRVHCGRRRVLGIIFHDAT